MYEVGEPSIEFDVPLYIDYVSYLFGGNVMDYCGSRTIGVAENSESWQNFLTVFTETRKLRIETHNHNDV